MSSDSLNPLRLLRGAGATGRFIILALVAAAVVAVWLVGGWATQPTWVPLYRGLELNEAAAVSDQLAKTDIQYRLDDGGTAVMVPVDDVARARVTLAKIGLPGNGGRPGLELFDKPSWGMTDFAQRVTYQRALEGELARTIGAIHGIQRAQVHLVLTAQSALRRLDHPASASVVLSLQPGMSLSPEAVQGITYIVSNSVEQLSSENVAVMDDAGHVLTVPSADGSVAGLTNRQLELQRSVEQQLAGKVERLLATVVGTGGARAQVTADLNFEQVDRQIESFDPNGQVLQNEQRSEPSDGDSSAGTVSVVNNSYQNSRKLEKIIGAVGTIQHLSVAVLVDERSLRADTATGRGAIQTATLEGMIRDAIGVDSARGDRLSVVAIPFEPATAALPSDNGTETAPPRDMVRTVERIGRPVIALVAIGALALLALSALRQTGRAPAAAGGADALAASRDRNLPELAPPPPPSMTALLRGRVQHETTERPELAAQVVRTWLRES